MRVAQVLTLVSSAGEYGGPQAVADSQARALRTLGHDVTVVAGRRPEDTAAEFAFDGPLRAVPVRSVLPNGHVSGLMSARALWAIASSIERSEVVHVHLARDAIPLAAALMAMARRRPYVVQTHGMVAPDQRVAVRLLDAMLVRPILRGARSRLVLSETEREDLQRVVGRSIGCSVVPNAAPPLTTLRARPGAREALFLARLHPRKKVIDFARAAQLSRGQDVDFVVVGPDAGDLVDLRAYLHDHPDAPLVYEGELAPRLTRARMAESGVFVLPSRNEPFPMAVLEALSVGLPCVVTSSCAIADQLERAGAAMVIPDGRPDLLASAVTEILDDSGRWRHMSRAALEMCEGELGEGALAELLNGVLADSVGAKTKAGAFR